MRSILFLILFTSGCILKQEKTDPAFSLDNIPEENWETFEGRWETPDGILRLELSLTADADEENSFYMLSEQLQSRDNSVGSVSKGRFSRYPGLPDNGFGIRLHNLSPSPHKSHFRVKGHESSDEMFFITRGTNELIPTDADFKPISPDRKQTLHKRLDYFTVEGYITFEGDSAKYFERNTMRYWKVIELGEYENLENLYWRLAETPHESIYLKALAYSIADTLAASGKVLVIKEIEEIDRDLEGE